MLTFQQFLEYRIVIPNKNKSKGILRKDMPQIGDGHYDDFITSVKASGHKIRSKTVDPKTLKPTQKEFSDKGIEKNLSRIGDDYKKPPIIVSKDNYIIDGHHRWAAHANAGEKIKINQIDLKVDDLLDFVHEYENVGYKSIYNK